MQFAPGQYPGGIALHEIELIAQAGRRGERYVWSVRQVQRISQTVPYLRLIRRNCKLRKSQQGHMIDYLSHMSEHLVLYWSVASYYFVTSINLVVCTGALVIFDPVQKSSAIQFKCFFLNSRPRKKNVLSIQKIGQ